MASDMIIWPLLEVPPQTPKSSSAAGAAQQRPPASRTPTQHLYVTRDEGQTHGPGTLTLT